MHRNEILNKEKLQEIREKGFTRIPVYDKNEDNIVGVLYSKDLIGLFEQTKKVGDFIKDLPPIAINDTMLLDKLMNHFIEKKVHMALVYDKYSTFIGVATLEDVIEEIIKVEIVDEADTTADMQDLAMKNSKLNILIE